MKFAPRLVSLLFAVASASANPVISKAKAVLVGETVHVKMLEDAAIVRGVFEFEDWLPGDGTTVYVPIFAEKASEAAQLLAQTGLELEVDGKRLGPASPCDVPAGVALPANIPRIFWFAADLDILIDDRESIASRRCVLKVSYSQPLIRGRFYYLPILAGESSEGNKRRWNYQMIIQATTRIPQVLSKHSDFEQLGSNLVIYLRNRSIVEVL
jgi:hypothetical protein